MSKEYVDELSLEAAKNMARELGENLSVNTKYLAVPRGTKFWMFFKQDPYYHWKYKEVRVPLINFFGKWIGYYKEADTIIMWED